ncbi:MAG TPA: TIGR02588 family protein [Acidimicrobiales bacterium]|nr:TIGR02588 family protein [Acidimicrobiales bacterium]
MTPTKSKRSRRERTSAEWVTFGISLFVLAVVVALIGVQALAGEDPPAPVVRREGEIRRENGKWFVPVTLKNHGDATAENVQVTASLTKGDDVVEADQSVDFLSGGETEELEFVFDEDPEEGELEVRVAGYQLP